MSELFLNDHAPDDILKLSSAQHATCMYSREELETFPQDKLNTIYAGIQALNGRPTWRRQKSLKELIGRGGGKKRGRKKKAA